MLHVQVEQLEEVERAFVHVDYMRRDGLEHKVRQHCGMQHCVGASWPDGYRQHGLKLQLARPLTSWQHPWLASSIGTP